MQEKPKTKYPGIFDEIQRSAKHYKGEPERRKIQGPRTSSPGELTPAIFPPSQLFWREREERRGEKKIKEKRIKAERREKAKPTKLGRVSGAGRARQPPGAAGAPLPTKGPSAAAGLHDIRQPATPSLLNLLLPAPLPAPRRPRGEPTGSGKRGKGGMEAGWRRDAAALAL